MTPIYSLIIRWSEDDQCYIAWVPEFGVGVKTHGATYEDAARAGREVIESLLETGGDLPQPLPQPWLATDPATDEAIGRHLFPSNLAYQEKVLRRTSPVKHATA